MLNIDVNINFDITKVKYPIRFTDNTCVHCGASGDLVIVDKFGRDTTSDIHPFDHIRCRKCGTNYSIMWSKDENGRLIPSACDHTFKHEIYNLLDYPKIKTHGVNKI